ncbi:hypothetical protein YC2023_082517 [Brassica napus]
MHAALPPPRSCLGLSLLHQLWDYQDPLKLTILGESLLFEILGAWRRLMCAKQVISLVETMKLRFFPDLFVQMTYIRVTGRRPPLFDKKNKSRRHTCKSSWENGLVLHLNRMC